MRGAPQSISAVMGSRRQHAIKNSRTPSSGSLVSLQEHLPGEPIDEGSQLIQSCWVATETHRLERASTGLVCDVVDKLPCRATGWVMQCSSTEVQGGNCFLSPHLAQRKQLQQDRTSPVRARRLQRKCVDPLLEPLRDGAHHHLTNSVLRGELIAQRGGRNLGLGGDAAHRQCGIAVSGYESEGCSGHRRLSSSLVGRSFEHDSSSHAPQAGRRPLGVYPTAQLCHETADSDPVGRGSLRCRSCHTGWCSAWHMCPVEVSPTRAAVPLATCAVIAAES